MNIFVIMPFGEDFDFIYSDLIKSICEEMGFEVHRADDIYSTRQILSDIVIDINSADLIIADLTENNSNVLYELGLAHGLNKPVQIITQSVENLPFDIHGYRVFEYSVHAKQYIIDKNSFKRMITELLDNKKTLFGNPVSDFLKLETPCFSRNNNIKQTKEDEQTASEESRINKGYFDHYAEFQETSKEIYNRLNKITGFTEEIGKTFNQHTEKIKKINENPNIPDKVSLARRLLISSSSMLAEYSSDIENFNEFVSQSLPQLRNNVEAIISYQKSKKPTEQQRKEYQEIFSKAIKSTDEAISQTNSFADVLHQFPNLQGQFTQQSRRAASSLENLTDNFLQIRALYFRLGDFD